MLTAFNAQKLRQMAHTSMTRETAAGEAVKGALSLYLDFVNLFFKWLDIFGRYRSKK
jgi:uncharacterized protein